MSSGKGSRKMHMSVQHTKAVLIGIVILIILATAAYVVHATHTADNLNSSVDKSTTQLTAKQQAAAAPGIVTAVAAANPTMQQPVVPIMHQDYTYAYGAISDGLNGTQQQWIAHHVKGTWTVIWQGAAADACAQLKAIDLTSWSPACQPQATAPSTPTNVHTTTAQ